RQSLLEPVLPGSVTFDSSILAPLRNNYLYEESNECFTYSSAYLINSAKLQERYSAFRAEKQKNGYSKGELEESFGFLLFDEKSRANTLADNGLMVGQGTCTILGDSSKGVYISKYSDCLDLKRWYDGKTGYIVLLKLTKGRVKEVTENYTQNFTPPTAGFDCHVSDQLGAVCATTSSFLAFERTQYYLYELLDGGNKPEPCPRHVCPFAVVAFSYGKTSTSLQLKEKSGQLKIESVVYNVGLQSIHGATSKTVKVDHAIGVSELRKTLPQSIFETSFLGEVSLDSRCFRLYDVVSLEEKSDLSLLTQELEEKDLVSVECSGVGTDKASGLQGLFIFPDSRTVPRETKRPHSKPKISAEVLRVLPALNYAESEMEKCPSSQQGEPLGTVEKHLQNFATLILPGLSSSPAREASMFPDQYDVPDGFPLIAPKWTEGAGACLKKYLNNPCGFVIPVARAVELLVPEKQQRSDDDHDDDVYYYISSPEEAPQTPAGVAVAEEGDVAEEAAVSGSNNEEVKTTTVVKEQTENQKEVPADVPHSALQEEDGTPGTVVVVVSSENPLNRTDSSPTSRELLEQSVEMVADSEKTPENVSANDANEHSGDTVESPQEISKETPLQTTSEPLTEEKSDVSSDVVAAKVDGANPHPEVEAEMLDDDISGSIPVVDKDVPKEADLPMSVSASTPSEKQIEELVVESEKVEPLTNSTNVLPHKKRNTKHLQGYRRRKRKGLKRSLKQMDEASAGPDHNTTTNTTPGQSSSSELVVDSSHSDPLRKDWRSLPRRKKLWSPDDGKKRALRSIVKSSETSETSVEKSKSPTITEPPSITESSVSSTPKRKMEGFNMRERYGLKTIITDCGFVFVPHGSEVAEADIKTSQDLKESKDSSLVSTTSPVKDKPEKNDSPIIPFPLQLDKDDQHSPLTHILQNLPINTAATAPSSQQISEKDSRSVQKNTEQSPTPEPKKSVYKAISISKLKTVLKRARQTKSQEKSESDNTEPELKKDKPSTDVDLNKSESGKLSPLKEVNKLTANEPSKTTPSKKVLVSWRELKSPPSHEKLKPKENGCITFGPSAPNELVKQAGPQPVSALTGNRVVGKAVSSEGKSSKAALATSPPLHSDALNLLADLALSANSEKMLPNPAKARKKSHAGAKTSNSPESVLHALLRGSSAKLKLPPQSPFPESLLVPGELLLEISKEHSYSQPASLLSGSSGAPPQFRPPAGSVGSLLSLDPKLHLKLPHHSSGTIYEERGGKNGWRHRASLDVPHPSSRVQRPRSFHHRHVIEKDGLLQVARLWKEKYDCRFDSRFTNDALEKSVTRALHGKWDFGIEDTFEQVHLIFHMWIGLFYSKRTSRFFHFDQNCAPLEKKDPPHVPNTISPIQAASKQPGVHLSSKEDKDDSLRPAADILDLSVKTSGPSSNCTVTQGNSKERPATSSDTKTSLVNTTESKKPSTTDSSHQAPNVPTKLPKTVLVMDVDESDGENDATTETPYTKLLEKNSAYSNLCEQASNMHIEDLKSLKGSLTVFHQVLLPIGPVILLKTFDPAPERKIILGPQSIKDNTGAVTVPALRPKEVVSKAQGGAALQTLENNNPSRSVVSDGSNVKKNAQTKVISVKDPTSKPDAGEDVSMHDPKLDARKDVSMHDEKNVNVRETNNKEKQAEVIPVDESSVGKIADVQDVIDNTEVGDGLPESLQNVDDEGKTEKEKEDKEEEIRPKPDVVDRTSVDEGHDDDQKKSMEVEMNEMVQEDAAKNDLNVLEENEKIDKVASDKIKESHECEKTEEEQHGTACDDHANSELDSNVHVSESRVSTSEKDCTDCVDMEISDGKDSEDESQVEELDEKVDSSSVKLQERETRAETSVVDNNDDKHTDDCNVQEESTKMADNLSAENQSLKKDHSDTSIQAESKSEGVVLDQSPQVQNKAPEISPTKSESVYSEISPRSTPTSPESGEIIESSDVDSTKAADEDDDDDDNLTISNTSVAQVQEADSSKEIESKGILKDENYEKSQHSSDSGEVSPASLEIDTENEINSRSCTPTQDELPYSLGGEDDLRIQRVLQLLDFHTPANSSPTACTDIEPDGSVCSTSSSGTGTHNSSSPKLRQGSDSDIPDWVHDFHYAASTSTVAKPNKRAFPFRHQDDDSDSSGSSDDSDVCYRTKKRKKASSKEKWDEASTYSINKTISSGVDRTKTLRTVTCSPYHQKRDSKQSFDWHRYFRREGIFDAGEKNHTFVQNPPSSIVTVLDKEGNRVIYENASSSKRSSGATGGRLNTDNTQSVMEQEYLVFSENMNQMVKSCKASSSREKSHHRSSLNPAENLMTIQFSRLDEQESSSQFDGMWPSLTNFKINVDMSERKGSRETGSYGKPLHLQSLFCESGSEASCSKISDISKECAKSYSSMMNDVCTKKKLPHQKGKMQRKWDSESTPVSKQPAFCGRIKKAMFDHLHDNLNSIVRQSCKIKYKFFILVTSDDPFFKETKDLLEAEGHTAVEPYEFDIDDNEQTPLIIIIRNEDIAEHICEVPHLLDLKKSSRVLFAGIDQPDDVVNLTHQELFAKGGFVVVDETAFDTLSLEHMKKVMGIMEELDKKGKWKWFLHYRDSRKLRENARCSPEAQMKKHFMDCCQEAGIVEVLPYHECDVISRDRPDYLRCLVRLQIQNASARFPVFITDTQTESFGKNGILTMNIYTLSRILSNDTCSVS
uniref:Transcription activation suppressor family member 2 n=1 Tax=Astyanax mexicanus TaxID=7994 RepID=W5KYR0_ASTMX